MTDQQPSMWGTPELCAAVGLGKKQQFVYQQALYAAYDLPVPGGGVWLGWTVEGAVLFAVMKRLTTVGLQIVDAAPLAKTILESGAAEWQGAPLDRLHVTIDVAGIRADAAGQLARFRPVDPRHGKRQVGVPDAADNESGPPSGRAGDRPGDPSPAAAR